MYEEWLDKYEYLIELGKSLKDYPEEAKTDDKLIKAVLSPSQSFSTQASPGLAQPSLTLPPA